MSLPPKSDDETSALSDGAKPAKPRGRPRGRKANAETEPAQEEAKAAIFVPEKRPEPEPVPAPTPVPQEAPQLPAAAQENRDVGGEPAGENDGRYGQGGGQGGRQGGGRGEWQDRNSWKRNKRKRGRHGGQWQPGPGGGAPRYPQQPPPPAPPPVYGDLPDPARFADLAALDALAKEISSGKGEPLFLDHLYSLNLADLTAFARGLDQDN